MAAVAAISISAGAAIAKPKVTQKVKTYALSATTVPGLLQEMKQRGPNGHWGYTDWYVQWTGDCRLTVTIDITLPKHKKPASMPADVRTKFDTMVAALSAHEQQHGQHAVMAATEIEKAGCKGGDAIIKKYNKVDIDFDRKTNHGAKQGVVLN